VPEDDHAEWHISEERFVKRFARWPGGWRQARVTPPRFLTTARLAGGLHVFGELNQLLDLGVKARLLRFVRVELGEAASVSPIRVIDGETIQALPAE